MDPAPSPDPAIETQTKRRQPPSHGGEQPTNVSKKRKTTSEDEIRRVAEIILVLSAMGRMRGGRDPTMAEKSMMTEAKTKIVLLCEDLSPKDILPYDDESFRDLIDDLGLNRFKDQFLGLRNPKLSILDRFHHSKRRMEEKSYADQPASYPFQRLQNGGAAGDHRGTPSNLRVISDKAGQLPVSAGGSHAQLPVSAGGSQAPIPVVQASAAPSMPLTSKPPGTEVRPPLVSGQVPHNKGIDTPATVPARVDQAHIRPDGRPNGPSFMQHTPASPSTNQRILRSTLQPMQAQPTQWTNSGTKNNVRDHPVRADGNSTLNTPQKTVLASTGQTVKPAAALNTPVSIPAVHHPVKGVQVAQGSSSHNRHLEISKLIQRLLDTKVPERPGWTTSSREYMNRAVNCPFCKITINGVEGMLVCDACEKGYHLGCLQSYNAKGIPRGEWHCPRCLAMNRGKPFPPKYGCVTRNMNSPNASSNATEVQSSSEKKVEIVGRKVNQPSPVTKVETVGGKVNQPSPVTKVETAEEKVNHPSPVIKVEPVYERVNQPSQVTNGNPGFQAHVPAGKAVESSSEPNLHGNEIKENNVAKVKKDDNTNLEKHPIHVGGDAVEAFQPTLTGSSIDKPPQQDVESVANGSGNKLISQAEASTSTIPHTNSISDTLPTSINQNDVDRESLSNGVVTPVHQHGNCYGIAEGDRNCKDRFHEKCGMPEDLSTGERFDNHAKGAESSENGLYSVDWIGDTDRVMDDKKFFQSCCVNGVVYKVQDYVLHCSGNDKVVPVKLLALWEDNKTNSKWLLVHKCYFPNDLPEEVGRPGAPLSNEVYESPHHSNVMAGFIQGPCEVLPFKKFGEESSQSSEANDNSRPVFIRNWFYDELKRAFCPTAS